MVEFWATVTPSPSRPADSSGHSDETAATYERLLEEGEGVRESLTSLRAFVAETRDAMKWFAAFAVAGLFTIVQTSGGQPQVVLAAIVLAAAALCFFISLMAAIAFYKVDLDSGEFVHETDVGIARLSRELGRAGRESPAIDKTPSAGAPTSVGSSVANAAQSVAQIKWPKKLTREEAHRSVAICIAGFLTGATLLLALALIRLVG